MLIIASVAFHHTIKLGVSFTNLLPYYFNCYNMWALRPDSHVRRRCKCRCKRKKIHVWTTVTQMQTQAQAPTQAIKHFSFSCTCICACVCISHVWIESAQTQGKKTQLPCHHGQPRPPSWKNTSTAPAYLTFLAFALDVWTSFAFAFALAFTFVSHVWTRLNQ